MKQFLLTLLAFFTLSTSGLAQDDQPYLAVFCSTGFYNQFWKKYQPDAYHETHRWDTLDDFVIYVKKQAGSRRILFDIDCHGMPDTGLLCLVKVNPDNSEQLYQASFGYIVNQLNKLNPKNLTVLTEACYAGYVFTRSLKPKQNTYTETVTVEQAKKFPTYPIYGVGKVNNYGNFIYHQYKLNLNIEFNDLRKFYRDNKNIEMCNIYTNGKDIHNQIVYVCYMVTKHFY